MATQIQLQSTNYNGQLADITFYPCSGGTISLGYQTIPYTYTNDYYEGTYDLFFSAFNQTCQLVITCPTPTPTVTPTNTATPTPTLTTTPTNTPTLTQTPTPSSTPWTPAQITGLDDWWTSTSGVNLSGSDVVSWSGYNGNLFTPTNSGRYALFTSGDTAWNNNPSLTINPSAAGGEWGYTASTNNTTQTKTQMIVCKKITSGNEDAVFLSYDNNFTSSIPRIAILTNTPDYWGYTSDMGAGTSYSTMNVNDANNTYFFGSMEYITSGTPTINWYGSNTSTLGGVKKTATTTSRLQNTIGLGTYFNILNSAKFSVVEVITINGVISGGDLTNLQNYINLKYGI
jgi:hypothetical protein